MSPRARIPARWRVSPLMVGWLTAVWVALWGNLSFANVLTGAGIALAILGLLPLPPGRARLAFRPWGLIRFVVLVASDLVVSSLRVAWQALWPGRLPHSSVMGVELVGRSDVMLTATVLALNVMPGTIVIEIRQDTPTVLYIHALGAETPAAIEAARRSVARLEARVIAAFGTREEFALLNRTRGGRS
jgi:multicomponent Na+:H+ antiporter subunit E